MRFSRLSLERYGRFEDCELDFRSGSPDLHVIYGENEAGKTTSLAAVSDLLFGFPVRSPYNFMFDYSLLRVGAVLEDGDTTLACRRKKGTSGTLLDADDAAIEESPLTAMLAVTDPLFRNPKTRKKQRHEVSDAGLSRRRRLGHGAHAGRP